MKTCSKCTRRKRLKLFCVSKRIKSGYTSLCKRCHTKKVNKWRRANPDKLHLSRRRWYRANREKASLYSIKHKYGLTSIQFKMLSVSQCHRCAICRKKRKLCVDHCHRTGVVRMLLCGSCNIAIGKLGDNPKLLIRAASLIRNPPARRILKL